MKRIFMTIYDAAIIGAGPAGIMAAVTASQNGRRVALIERNPMIGRKLLATGNGRCNLTNRFASPDRYHGANPEFIGSVLGQFDQNETMSFFRDLGLILKEEELGRIFPRTNQATSVVEILGLKLRENGVDILLDSQVKAIERSDHWKVALTNGETVESQALILATGGWASNQFGSTGDGLYWAQKLGHSITPIYAALVPVETVETWTKEVQGIKVEAMVRATVDGKTINETTDDVLFTSYGISGTAVMTLAGSIAPFVKDSEVLLHIDLFPDLTPSELDELLQMSHRKSVRDILIGVLPGALIPVVLKLSGVDENNQPSKLLANEHPAIAKTMKDLTLTVSKLRPMKEAYVTSGGLKVDEIDPPTLESNLVRDLFFAGEILDVDGDSGGFNLQWAWSSGRLAGKLGK